MLRTAEVPLAASTGANALVKATGPKKFVSMISRKFSSERARNVSDSTLMPALLIRTVTSWA